MRPPEITRVQGCPAHEMLPAVLLAADKRSKLAALLRAHDVRIAGGDGSSIKSAVRVTGASDKTVYEGVVALWLARNHPGISVKKTVSGWRGRSQGSRFDLYELSNGQKLYFEVPVFSKRASISPDQHSVPEAEEPVAAPDRLFIYGEDEPTV